MCSHCGYETPGEEEEEMVNPFQRLTESEKRVRDGFARIYLTQLFEEFMLTIEADERKTYFDDRNRDDYMRDFGAWLAHHWPEFASND